MRGIERATTRASRAIAHFLAALALAWSLSALCGATTAHAQRARPRPRGTPSADASAPTERARQLFERGLASLADERWDEARVLFEEAWSLSPRPSILVNLGTAQRQCGRLVEARASYRTFLERFATHDLAARTRTSLAEVDALIPHITIHVEGWRPGDEVFLDDVAVTTLAESFAANPGLRQVSLWRDGRVLQSVRVRVELEGNEEVFLRAIDAGAAPGTVAATTPAATTPAATTPAATPSSGGGSGDLTGLADVDWSGTAPTQPVAASSAGRTSPSAPVLASPTAPRRETPAEAAPSGGSRTGLIVGVVVGAVAVVAGGVALGLWLGAPEPARAAIDPTIRAGVLTFQ